MPGYQTHILSTRPLQADLLDQAAGRGIVIDAFPFITTAPVAGEELRQEVRELAERPLVVVFTSMNAVEAVAGHLDIKSGAGHRTPNGGAAPALPWQIFCIGAATSRLVGEYFGEERITGTAGSAAALANVLIAWMTGRQSGTPAKTSGLSEASGGRPEVFFFCGDQRRDELPAALRKASVPVHERIVYTTMQTPRKMDQTFDGVVFFSPSAVHSFFSVNMTGPGTLFFAIGETTADTIRSYSSNRTILSDSPDKETFIRQVIDHFQNHI